MKKKEFFEYYNIIDIRSKLKEIEKNAEKENKISWELLINEIKKNVIMNDTIKEFISKTEENIYISKIYFSAMNTITDDEHDRINKENNNNFEIMKTEIIKNNIGNINFYKNQKHYIYKDIIFINLLTKKYMKADINIKNNRIAELIEDKVKVLKIRTNVLKLFYKNKMDEIIYEDDIIFNISKIDDIKIVEDYIENNKNIYFYGELPKYIKIKENNKNNILSIFNTYYTFYELYKVIYKNKQLFEEISNNNNIRYLKENGNIVEYKFTFYNILKIKHLDYYPDKSRSTLKYYTIYIFTIKQFKWLIYKFNKIS